MVGKEIYHRRIALDNLLQKSIIPLGIAEKLVGDDTMKYVCHVVLSLVLCMPAHATEEAGDCSTPIVINTVELEQLIPIYVRLTTCVSKHGNAVAFVRGPGGSIDDALAFFDLIRTTPGLAGKITFIATGEILSASTLVWLAAGKRILLPGTKVVIHRGQWNMPGEDHRTRTEYVEKTLVATQNAVRTAAGEEASDLWARVLRGDEQGRVLSAKEAMELGWATELREYP